MKRIVFDNSIHLGQFNIGDELMRISSKNSQAMISAKPESEVIGIETFNENSYSDDIIWGIARDPQDTFYRFMDAYHSLKNVTRVPLVREDMEKALVIQRELNISISNALTLAVALSHKANEIHTFYSELLDSRVVKYASDNFGVSIGSPDSDAEEQFANKDLEKFYQGALKSFKEYKINLVDRFHS
jgi:predicted nucleic acid-binding protein